jgi:hypothetical protein
MGDEWDEDRVGCDWDAWSERGKCSGADLVDVGDDAPDMCGDGPAWPNNRAGS